MSKHCANCGYVTPLPDQNTEYDRKVHYPKNTEEGIPYYINCCWDKDCFNYCVEGKKQNDKE